MKNDEIKYSAASRLATTSTTFYCAVISSVACAEFWDCQTNQQTGYKLSADACELIAKTGYMEVLKWAHQKKYHYMLQGCHCGTFEGLEVCS
jgi:hypothetical protein